MTQLRRDAAYIRTKRTGKSDVSFTDFDEQVCDVLSTPHTVTSAARTLTNTKSSEDRDASDLESSVAASMLRLLQAERIELSPDS